MEHGARQGDGDSIPSTDSGAFYRTLVESAPDDVLTIPGTGEMVRPERGRRPP